MEKFPPYIAGPVSLLILVMIGWSMYGMWKRYKNYIPPKPFRPYMMGPDDPLIHQIVLPALSGKPVSKVLLQRLIAKNAVRSEESYRMKKYPGEYYSLDYYFQEGLWFWKKQYAGTLGFTREFELISIEQIHPVEEELYLAIA